MSNKEKKNKRGYCWEMEEVFFLKEGEGEKKEGNEVVHNRPGWRLSFGVFSERRGLAGSGVAPI